MLQKGSASVKFLSLFSGIGAPEKALDNLGIPYELEAYCEIDKYASKSYAAIHGVSETMNLGDITKVDESKLPKDIDLCFYGFPCQDISVAGTLKGMFNEDGTQTRSGLFFEALRIIESAQPKIAIAENVKNLTSKRFAEQFKIVLTSLEQAGYNNYWQILNAKNFGIPQNRERVFIVSIRKDIDNGTFQFPEGFPLELRLKDVLEESVGDKYYLSDNMVNYVTASVEGCGFGGDIDPPIARTLTATMHKMHRAGVDNYVSDSIGVHQIGNCSLTETRDNPSRCVEVANLNHYKNDQMNRVYSPEGVAPTITTKTGGGRETKILTSDHTRPLLTIDGDIVKVREATKRGYAEAHEGDSINIEQPSSTTRRGRVGKQVAQTLNTTCHLQAVAVAMRGRYSEDGAVEQHIEVSDREYANAITTVQKDSLVAEPVCLNSKGGRGGVEGLQPSLQDRVYDSNAIATAVTTCFMPSYTVVEPNVLRQERSEYGKQIRKAYDAGEVNEKWAAMKEWVPRTDGISNTLSTVQKDNLLHDGSLRIRKLTPKECFRLMGFDDSDFEKAEAVVSNTQLYKQAGNSIVVQCMVGIFKNAFSVEKEESYTLF